MVCSLFGKWIQCLPHVFKLQKVHFTSLFILISQATMLHDLFSNFLQIVNLLVSLFLPLPLTISASVKWYDTLPVSLDISQGQIWLFHVYMEVCFGHLNLILFLGCSYKTLMFSVWYPDPCLYRWCLPTFWVCHSECPYHHSFSSINSPYFYS